MLLASMATYFDVLIFSLIGGVISLIGGILLISRKRLAVLLLKVATPFAAGALLAAVFLDLLPEGIEASTPQTVLTFALLGIIGFFFMERFLSWFHHHHEHDKKAVNGRHSGLIIVGDTLHNALDGVAIATAFLINVPTGIVTTIAIAAHEIPQEIGDFGLLLSRGMRRLHVLLVNIGSALATTVAALITFAIGSDERLPIGALLGISAGFLLYIALSDVIPTIHEHLDKKRRFVDGSSLLLILGVVIVASAVQLSHSYLPESHHHEESAEHSQAEADHHE